MWRVKHRAPTEPRSWLIAGLYKHWVPSGTTQIRQQHTITPLLGLVSLHLGCARGLEVLFVSRVSHSIAKNELTTEPS